jgi:hypothetical protein
MSIDIIINGTHYQNVDNSFYLSRKLSELSLIYPEVDYDTDVRHGKVYLTIPNFRG